MKISMRHYFYFGLVVSLFVIVIAIIFFLFPYQKMLKVVFQDVIAGKNERVSFVDVRRGFGSVSASRIIVGHDRMEGQPFVELEKVKLLWNPFSIFNGAIDIYSSANSYNGTTKFYINNLPFLLDNNTYLTIVLQNLNLEKYPKNALPWLKSFSGVLNGTIKREILFLTPERQKGSFAFTVKEGILSQIKTEGGGDLTLQFKDLIIEGKSNGDTVILDKILINCKDVNIKGNGILEVGINFENINMDLAYESSSQEAPLPRKGKIITSGSIWSPKITIIQEPVN